MSAHGRAYTVARVLLQFSVRMIEWQTRVSPSEDRRTLGRCIANASSKRRSYEVRRASHIVCSREIAASTSCTHVPKAPSSVW